jgi:MIP family channel proteins
MGQSVRIGVAEFIGTFALCFIGQGAIVVAQMMGAGPGALLGIAAAHGLALATMISALGAVSGGHFNPAVTFAFVVTGRQKIGSALGYWIAQLLGAVVASFLLRSFLPEAAWRAVHLGAPALAPGIGTGAGVAIEIVATFFLVTAVWGTAVDERHPPIGGFGIGLTVMMDILFAGPLTGAAMNPARAFGAALLGGAMEQHWIWWVGPIVGGAVAALLYDRLLLGRRAAKAA